MTPLSDADLDALDALSRDGEGYDAHCCILIREVRAGRRLAAEATNLAHQDAGLRMALEAYRAAQEGGGA